MKETVLVTGATGHIGNNLCKRLLRDNAYKVRCLVRKTSDLTALKGLDLEKFYGDVLDYDSFLKASRGCDYLFHLAAVYSHNPNRQSEIQATANQGIENFLRVCKEGSIKKAVYTSSVAALGVSDCRDRLIDENGYVSGECEAYTKAKLDAQLLVEKAIREDYLPIVIVLPSTVIGENDYKITPSNQMILRFIRQPNFAYIDAGVNIVHISDVVEGHLQAHLKGKIGEKYIIAGTNITIYDLMSKVASLTGRKKPFIKLSKNIVYPLAVLFDLFVRLTNQPAPISKVQAKTRIGKFGFYSIEKAQKEFNYTPKDLETALKKSLDWYKQEKLI